MLMVYLPLVLMTALVACIIGWGRYDSLERTDARHLRRHNEAYRGKNDAEKARADWDAALTEAVIERRVLGGRRRR